MINMILDKYKMTNERVVYCYTIVEFLRRGYGLVEINKMLKNAKKVFELIKIDPEYFFHYDEDSWADCVIDANNNDIPKEAV